MGVSYKRHPDRAFLRTTGNVYSGVSPVFRLFVSTTARFGQARGLASAAAFAIDCIGAAPWALRWNQFIDRFCHRHFGTAAPLDLVRAGLMRPGGLRHSRRIARLRAHYDIIAAYFTDNAAARMVFERSVPMAVIAGEGGCVYQLEILTPHAERRGEGELMLALSHAGGLVATLPFRFGYCGGNRLALRLGHMHISAGADTVEADLYGLPVRAMLMDGVYAMARTLGTTEITAELDGASDLWGTFMGDCGAVYRPGGRFDLPLEGQFWHSDAGRLALGEAWVPQQMARAELMSQANAAVSSWLRYDEAVARRAVRPATVAAAK